MVKKVYSTQENASDENWSQKTKVLLHKHARQAVVADSRKPSGVVTLPAAAFQRNVNFSPSRA